MSLLFDTKVKFIDSETISTIITAHKQFPLLAISSYNSNGGTVTLFDSDSGEAVKNVRYPSHAVSQTTSLCFHPSKQILLTGWENGEIHVWLEGKREFLPIQGSSFHKTPIMLIEFSEQGGRLVTADSNGTLTGWRCDNQGQFLTMFSHDLRDPLLNITFRRTIENSTSTELKNLAKLAVAGDQIALDTLTTWRPKTAVRNNLSTTGVKDNHCFYVGAQSGILFHVNQSGACTEIIKTDSPIIQMLFHPSREAVVTLMEDMTIAHYLVEASGNLTELDRVKLSSKISGYDGSICWAENSIAILCDPIRIWDIDTGENFLLPIDHGSIKNIHPKHFAKASNTETFTSISYCFQNQKLCASTNQGAIYIWKKIYYNADSENGWQLVEISHIIKGSIKKCIWGIDSELKPCIVANCISNVYILKEQPLMSYHMRDVWAVQRATNQIFIETSTQQTTIVNCDISVTQVCLTDIHMVITNGKMVMIYKIQKTSNDSIVDTEQSLDANRITLHDNLVVRFSSSFHCDNSQIFIYEQHIICMNQKEIIVLSENGVKLQQISLSEHEGKIIGADLSTKYLTIFTYDGSVKIYDASRHELKLIVPPKNAYDLFDNFGEIIMAKVNKNGTICALTIANEKLIPDGRIYFWNLEQDITTFHDFLPENKFPVNFNWDDDDHRLIAIETKLIHQNDKRKRNEKSPVESQIYIMFPTNSKIFEIEVIDLAINEQLFNLCIPNVVTIQNGIVDQKILRDFKGLQSNTDAATRKMVLDFSLNVAQGNLDQAFFCIRSLQSETVWTNLARMCVHSGNLSVAQVCLGHLKQARSVRAVRKAINDNTLEPEAKIAVLAIELDMIEEAENLYKKCGRFDLLNRLLQNCGRFEEAQKIAEFDRVHLKNTYMKHAQWLSENNQITEALKLFQQTSDPVHCITQLLMDDPNALRKYMQSTTNPEMLKWYAQYIESTGDMESAFKIYQKTDDYFSQVRILCFLGQISKAETVARNSNDKSACYHLARQFENIGKFEEAIQFYTRANTFGNAVRICKENDLQKELWNIASIARNRDKISAAQYFEEVGDFKKAVELYHRAGLISKAIELAFTSQQSDIIQVIASELDEKSDPELITRCAEFFENINLPQKSIMLLAKARQFEKALDVCANSTVYLTDHLTELLTPTKDDDVTDERKNEILEKVGDILQVQGDYHLAAKKFTQASNKIKAMKSLLKSGDTEKIIFFAGMTRQKEIYIMAGNYLQSLDWQNDPKILKNIISFYTKGQAFDLLANFYTVSAQVEIEEFRDYGKALKALQEAAKCLIKISPNHSALETLKNSILNVKRVIELQELAERHEFSSVNIGCKNMLTLNQNQLTPVSSVDILALFIESQISLKQYTEALTSLKELSIKQPDWSTREIIDRALIEKLAHESNIDFNSLWNSGRNPFKKQLSIDQTDDEEQEEEEDEEIEENLE